MASKRMSAGKANMRGMAAAGGLKGFKNGGGTYDGLMKAQPGGERPPDYWSEANSRARQDSSQAVFDSLKTTFKVPEHIQQPGYYQAGYADSKGISHGTSKAGITLSPDYQAGVTAGSVKPKRRGGSTSKKRKK